MLQGEIPERADQRPATLGPRQGEERKDAVAPLGPEDHSQGPHRTPGAPVHRLYRGELRGLILLLRDETESANAALESTLPGLTDERRSSAASGRFRVLDHDDAMALALATTPRAIGVSSLAAVRPPLRALRLDGLAPSNDSLARGTWRAVRTLGVVFRPERRDRVAPFLALASSERGRALIRSLGYLPMEPRR